MTKSSLTKTVKKIILFLFMGVLSWYLLISASAKTANYPAANYDLVIYGAGLGGCAAAVSAAQTNPDCSILLINPDPSGMLGGLATSGGQNFFDLRRWHGHLVQGGSFARWYSRWGQFYNTAKAAADLQAEITSFPNIHLINCYDIYDLRCSSSTNGSWIKTLVLRQIARDKSGTVSWHGTLYPVKGHVFIDASEDGRLSRMAGLPLLSGRADWPLSYLPEDEKQYPWQARQQAATLMFKVRGISLPPRPGVYGSLVFTRDLNGSWGLAGGNYQFANDPVLIAFNRKYTLLGLALKPLNAAQDGTGSDEWWLNTLLIFNVDGCRQQRDTGSRHQPLIGTIPGAIDTDTAYRMALSLLEKEEFWQALRRFSYRDPSTGTTYGLAYIEPVRDARNKPVVANILYLRETVHLVQQAALTSQVYHLIQNSRNSGKNFLSPPTSSYKYLYPRLQEEVDFVLTSHLCQKAGATSLSGSDSRYAEKSIGLAYYAMDINAYLPQDLTASPAFVWPVTGKLRPDWLAAGGEPANPVYLPYELLLAPPVENLLVCGYAVSASSFAWAELRVLPNLCVLGDAAGTTAALCLRWHLTPAAIKNGWLPAVRQALKEKGALLTKEEILGKP